MPIKPIYSTFFCGDDLLAKEWKQEGRGRMEDRKFTALVKYIYRHVTFLGTRLKRASGRLWKAVYTVDGTAPGSGHHCLLSLRLRMAVNLRPVSFTEAALPLGGCDWGRAGSPELLTFLSLYGVGEAVGFGSLCRLGGLVPRPQFCLALLCSRWWLTAVAG